jgi:hypothetical protein
VPDSTAPHWGAFLFLGLGFLPELVDESAAESAAPFKSVRANLGEFKRCRTIPCGVAARCGSFQDRKAIISGAEIRGNERGLFAPPTSCTLGFRTVAMATGLR